MSSPLEVWSHFRGVSCGTSNQTLVLVNGCIYKNGHNFLNIGPIWTGQLAKCSDFFAPGGCRLFFLLQSKAPGRRWETEVFFFGLSKSYSSLTIKVIMVTGYYWQEVPTHTGNDIRIIVCLIVRGCSIVLPDHRGLYWCYIITDS